MQALVRMLGFAPRVHDNGGKMSLNRRDVLKYLSYSMAAGVATSFQSRKASAGGCGVIERDVCVLGGGSSGCYTAVRLRDARKSVVVVELNNRLGGPTET